MIQVWHRYKSSFGRYDGYEIVHVGCRNYRVLGAKIDPKTNIVNWEVVTQEMTLEMARLFVANHIEWKDGYPVYLFQERR